VLIGEGNQLHIHDLASGAVLQKVELPATVQVAGIAIANGAVVVSCGDGSVVGLR
jgi:hypothetical protein